MTDEVRLLFRELADLSPARREEIFAARGITSEVRTEVESLLSFDPNSGEFFTDRVARAAEAALQQVGPATCGPYRIIRRLGTGGMGTVYLAERTDGEIQQKVAVKLLRADADRPSWQGRFLRERQLLANLSHPSVARLLDAGRTAEGQPYLAMEYVDGVPIDAFAAGKSLREQLELFLKVCDGVAHAHRLIIHRDLKPSNILVDASGQPKLLDFGIAKLLDETTDPTQTIERMMTPNYASPEQLRGAPQTTMTDVYSLGAVLYRLVVGRSPHESAGHASKAIDVATGKSEIPAPSRLNANLPSDLDFILRKALRHEPEERYASVEALANDIGAFLEWQPVQARSGDRWYRARKFVRRHWAPAAAMLLVVASLAAGLYVANRERIRADQQRALAEHRFAQLRQLSTKIFELDTVIRYLPGSTAARRSLVQDSLEYLEGLSADVGGSLELAQEVGEGYWRIGRVLGVPTDLNLGNSAEAEVALQKADRFIDLVLANQPTNRKALLLSAKIGQDRMILADSDHHRTEALLYAGRTVERLNAFLPLGKPSDTEISEAVAAFGNVGLAYLNLHHYPEAVALSRRVVEMSALTPVIEARKGQGLSVLANALRFQGDLDGALAAIQEAKKIAEHGAYPTPTTRMLNFYGVLLREGLILGEDGGINLNRPEDAIQPLEAALDMTEDYARKDAKDAVSRGRVGTSARELGNILRHREPRRALEVYDLGIRRLGELPNNLKARRDRAVLLAVSAYALRQLGRQDEAGRRIQEALAILKGTKDYPADQVGLDSEVYSVTTAMADHLAETGDPKAALQTYQDLLSRVNTAKPDPTNDLREAPKMSQLYESLAALYRRTNSPAEAQEMTRRAHDLWQNWDRKLPKNAFIQRQLSQMK